MNSKKVIIISIILIVLIIITGISLIIILNMNNKNNINNNIEDPAILDISTKFEDVIDYNNSSTWYWYNV